MKNIKILSLICNLIISLSIISCANSKEQNMNIKSYSENTKIKNNMFTQDFEDKAIKLISFYSDIWESDQETKRRNDIKNRLKEFNNLYVKFNNQKNINKNIQHITNIDFNLLQSILLDYYEFSVLFNAKYSLFISLISQDIRVHNLKVYKSFCDRYSSFIYEIESNIKNIDLFCCDMLLFYNNLNQSRQVLKSKNITPSQSIIEKTSKKILNLKSNFQKLFKNTQTDMKSQLWANTFTKDQIYNNNFINENSSITDLDIIPKNFTNCKISYISTNNIMSYYKVNLHILTTVLKMELLKSLDYMKILQKNNLKYDLNLIFKNKKNVFNSYKKFKSYANTIYQIYNSLRFFIIFYAKKEWQNHQHNHENKHLITINRNIIPKNLDDFNKRLSDYILEENGSNEILNLSTYEMLFAQDYKKMDDIFERQYYANKLNVKTIDEFYVCITQNYEYYINLLKSSTMQDLDKSYSKFT